MKKFDILNMLTDTVKTYT